MKYSISLSHPETDPVLSRSLSHPETDPVISASLSSTHPAAAGSSSGPRASKAKAKKVVKRKTV
jgi:hypothetical protein